MQVGVGLHGGPRVQRSGPHQARQLLGVHVRLRQPLDHMPPLIRRLALLDLVLDVHRVRPGALGGHQGNLQQTDVRHGTRFDRMLDILSFCPGLHQVGPLVQLVQLASTVLPVAGVLCKLAEPWPKNEWSATGSESEGDTERAGRRQGRGRGRGRGRPSGVRGTSSVPTVLGLGRAHEREDGDFQGQRPVDGVPSGGHTCLIVVRVSRVCAKGDGSITEQRMIEKTHQGDAMFSRSRRITCRSSTSSCVSRYSSTSISSRSSSSSSSSSSSPTSSLSSVPSAPPASNSPP